MGGRGSTSAGRNQTGAERIVGGQPRSTRASYRQAGAEGAPSDVTQAREAVGRANERLLAASYAIDEARQSPRDGRAERVEAAIANRNRLRDAYDAAAARLNELEDGTAAPSEPGRTFVNSYGEATRREITSQSYQSAQRRLQRDVEGFLGRGLTR